MTATASASPETTTTTATKYIVQSLTVPACYLAALMQFAPRQDIRTFLNAIYIEVTMKNFRFVATNGHAMAVFTINFKENEEPAMSLLGNHLISIHDLPSITKTDCKNKETVTFEWVNEVFTGDLPERYNKIDVTRDGYFNLAYKLEPTVECLQMDYRYPDYRRVIPGELSGEAAQYSAEMMKITEKACAYINSSEPKLQVPVINCNGQRAAVVDFHALDFMAVIMPIIQQKRSPTWKWALEE